jgi:hypothetical protein
MTQAYRSAYEHIVGTRLAEMKLAQEMVEPFLPRLRSVRSARVARVIAGSVGIVAAIVMVLCACLDDGGAATKALIGGAGAAAGSYVLVRAILAFRGVFGKAPAWKSPKLTGQLDADLACIDASNPLRALSRRLGGLEVWSAALPLAAISLLAPLTLHCLFCAVTSASESATAFAKWIRISLLIVGHAHLTLMGLAIAFSRKMARLNLDELARMPIHHEWAKALGITVGVSAVPGVILLGIPPVLCALTGIAFVPFMFALMRRRILNERATMALAEEANIVRIARDPIAATTALEEANWSELDAPEEARSLTARM